MPRRPSSTSDFMRPREAATGDIGGEPFVLNPNEIFDADHPIVRAHPGLFMPVEPSRQSAGRGAGDGGSRRANQPCRA
jgi:hypothetical protein